MADYDYRVRIASAGEDYDYREKVNMSQEVLTKEEAKRRDRFHQLNREIVEGYKEAVSGQVRMLKAFWEVRKDELWKLEYDKVEDWLNALCEAGVKYAARSTFYAKMELINKYINIVGEDASIQLAAEHHGSLTLLETSQTLSFRKDGRGQSASFDLVEVDESRVEGDLKRYLESLTKMSSKQALYKVREDTGKDAFVKVTWMPDHFYWRLIDEINRLYKNKLPMSLATLIRKLLENLIIDILRKKYGTAELTLYYDTTKGRFHDFSILVKNLDAKKADFRYITQNLDKAIHDINQFKEKGNQGAHSMDADLTIEHFSKDKERINHLVQLLLRIIQNIE